MGRKKVPTLPCPKLMRLTANDVSAAASAVPVGAKVRWVTAERVVRNANSSSRVALFWICRAVRTAKVLP